MYIPPIYRNSNLIEVSEFIKNHGFATLVNLSNGKLWATHIPLELDVDENGKEILSGHVSKGNQQWKSFEENPNVLAIFHGPHSYISSSWYNHENVPTWNYIAVHVYGKARLITEERLERALSNLMDKYESMTGTHLKFSDYSDSFLRKEMRGIVGFEIDMEEIQAAYKLSQNRDKESHENVIDQLNKSEDETAKKIAEEMRKKRRS